MKTMRWGQLFVACLLSLVTVFCCGAAAKAAQSEYELTAQQLSQAAASFRQLTAQAAAYDAVFRRDPMQALVDEQGQAVSSLGMHGGLSVQGIIWSPDHPLVVVDDDLIGVGEDVGPYRIVEIQSNGVTVKRAGEAAQFVPLDRGLEAPPEAASPEAASPAP